MGVGCCGWEVFCVDPTMPSTVMDEFIKGCWPTYGSERWHLSQAFRIPGSCKHMEQILEQNNLASGVLREQGTVESGRLSAYCLRVPCGGGEYYTLRGPPRSPSCSSGPPGSPPFF